jgi:hypothetical protein
LEDEEVAVFCLEGLGSFHDEGVAEGPKALHGLGVVADEDAGLAVGVVEVGLAVWGFEKLGYKVAGYLGVVGDGDLTSINDWILERCDFADEVLGKMFSDVIDLLIVSILILILTCT